MAKRNSVDTEFYFSTEEVIELLSKVPLNSSELRKAIRPASLYFYDKAQKAVGTKWGVRTGRMKTEGISI